MNTIYITNDPWRAQVADQAGVTKVMVDLEILGKVERQGGLDTVISRHQLSDVRQMRGLLKSAQLLVRTNPLNPNSAREVEECLEAGADILMLPMFASADDVKAYLDLVAGRARTCMLLETGSAMARIHEIVEVDGVDEIHIGLNDLSLGLNVDFMFEVLSGGLVDLMADAIRKKGIPFGFGGIARLSKGLLDASLILSEHVRLGSSQVIISRDFNKIFDEEPREAVPAVFKREIASLHQCLDRLSGAGEDELLSNREELRRAVTQIARNVRASKAKQAAQSAVPA